MEEEWQPDSGAVASAPFEEAELQQEQQPLPTWSPGECIEAVDDLSLLLLDPMEQAYMGQLGVSCSTIHNVLYGLLTESRDPPPPSSRPRLLQAINHCAELSPDLVTRFSAWNQLVLNFLADFDGERSLGALAAPFIPHLRGEEMVHLALVVTKLATLCLEQGYHAHKQLAGKLEQSLGEFVQLVAELTARQDGPGAANQIALDIVKWALKVILLLYGPDWCPIAVEMTMVERILPWLLELVSNNMPPSQIQRLRLIRFDPLHRLIRVSEALELDICLSPDSLRATIEKWQGYRTVSEGFPLGQMLRDAWSFSRDLHAHLLSQARVLDFFCSANRELRGLPLDVSLEDAFETLPRLLRTMGEWLQLVRVKLGEDPQAESSVEIHGCFLSYQEAHDLCQVVYQSDFPHLWFDPITHLPPPSFEEYSRPGSPGTLVKRAIQESNKH